MIRVWDLQTKQPLFELESQTGTVYSLVITPSMKLLSGNWDKTLRLYNLETKENTLIWKGKAVIRSMVLTKDYTKIITGSADNVIRIWDLETYKILSKLKGHNGPVRVLSLTPNSDKIVSGSYDNSIRVWDLNSGEIIGHLEGQGSFYSLLLSPDSNYLLSGSYEKSIRIWDLKNNNFMSQLEGHTNVIRSLICSYDSKQIISGSADKTIKVWDIDTKELIRTLEGHEDTVYCLLLDTDLIRLYSGSYDKNIIVWDAFNGEPLGKLIGHTGPVLCLLLVPNQRKILSGSSDSTIRLWNLDLYKETHVLLAHESSVKCLMISPNNKLFFSGSEDKSVKIWGLADLKCKNQLNGHSATVKTLIITPDSKKIISGSYDHSIRIWDIDSGIELDQVISNIPLNIHPFIRVSKERILALLGHVVYDFNNEMALFSISEYNNLTEILYCPFKKNFICIDKDDVLSMKSFQNITLFGNNFSLIQSFFNGESIDKKGLMKKPILLPFYYNFLHIIAIFDNKHPFHFTKFEEIELPIEYFLQIDFMNQTCIDIAILLNLKSLLKIYMELLIKALKNTTTSFYHKMKIFAYDYNFDRNKNIYPFFFHLLELFDKDTTILSHFFELSYLMLDPLCFFSTLSSDELYSPLFLVIENVSDLQSEKALKQALNRKSKWKFLSNCFKIYKNPKKTIKIIKNSQVDVKCKIILLKGLTDINETSCKVHKKILTFNPNNQFFSNPIFQDLIRYKWENYARRYLLQEFLSLLLIFFVYLSNNIYILPARNLNKDFGDKYDVIALVFDLILIVFFIFYTIKESFQLKRLGLVTYFSSPWNWCDFSLIPLVISGACIDIYQLFNEDSEMNSEKIVNSITLLVFWCRILSYSRAFEGTGFMVRLVLQVILDMKYFLFLIFLFCLAFGSSGFMLQRGFEITQWDSFTLWYRLMLGDFNLYDGRLAEEAENGVVIWAIMIIFTLLLSVIMLNLLISIIGETFAKVRAAEASMKYYELYSIIFEIDDSLSKGEINWLRSNKKIGNYLVCLYNENSQFGQAEMDNQNLLVESGKRIEREVGRIAEELGAVGRELKEFKKNIAEDINEIKTMLLKERRQEENFKGLKEKKYK